MTQPEGRDAPKLARTGAFEQRGWMARKPTSMRHVKDILRLKFHNQLSLREIARSCGLAVSTVGDYLQRAEAAGLSWPLRDGLSDPELMDRLLNSASAAESPPPKPLPDWSAIRVQPQRKGLTLQLLWQEYRQAYPDGYRYSRFCESGQSLVLRSYKRGVNGRGGTTAVLRVGTEKQPIFSLQYADWEE